MTGGIEGRDGLKLHRCARDVPLGRADRSTFTIREYAGLEDGLLCLAS